MDLMTAYSFPAGDESEGSNDDWDIGFCLDKSMDVETRLSFDWTPLMCAVSMVNYELTELLLDRGAGANFSKDNWTVLMACCSAAGSEDKIARCVEILLSRNADPNMVDRSQMTCLMLAAWNGRAKVINLLVSHGAEINIQDGNGLTIGRILASSSHIATMQAFSSMEENLSKFFTTNSEPPPSKESVTKLNDLELFLHGLNLGHLSDIMTENDITWSYLLTMEKQDLEKVGITDRRSSRKSEDLHNFLISVRQQCCYLTEKIQDVNGRFPRQASQLVFSLDPKKEAQAVCNQLVIQTRDLQKEVTCLRNILCKMEEVEHFRPLPQLGIRRKRFLSGVALSALGASVLLLLLQMNRSECVFNNRSVCSTTGVCVQQQECVQQQHVYHVSHHSV
ncbi:hypothetical protein F7725_023303 [Dissostichus mawsoni]|uniref:Ankyrin repeat, SAM and basic leucine zipper domain-containing protein 1 n=1 Tax=Dissostichus mawsoni TaxID=36200 RepID=A0A7J5Z4L3_DISMA|nr:hypothetical protein F7725_023303 [Dissostichus mawsoni]